MRDFLAIALLVAGVYGVAGAAYYTFAPPKPVCSEGLEPARLFLNGWACVARGAEKVIYAR